MVLNKESVMRNMVERKGGINQPLLGFLWKDNMWFDEFWGVIIKPEPVHKLRFSQEILWEDEE